MRNNVVKNNGSSRHHIIPVSLRWPDIKENIVLLKNRVHSTLHNILDIHPRIYGKMQRRIKEKTNHKLLLWEEDLKIWHDMQRLFFDRINHLPIYVQQIHIKKMRRIMNRQYGRYKDMTGDKLDAPKSSLQWDEQFREYHEKMMEAEREIAKVISLVVKEHFKGMR